MKIGILYGDLRYKFLYDMLKNENKEVVYYKNSNINNVDNYKNIDEFLKDINILITSIPFSKDNKTVFNMENEIIYIDDLINLLKKHNIKTLCCGAINKDIYEKIKKNNIEVLDFLEGDNVAILNAIPTAEGALQTAIEQSVKTIFNSKCLVLGYGRCGKVLSNMLKGIGASVDVSYRKDVDNAYIVAYGLNPVNLYEMKNIEKYDFIFNTIPYKIIDEQFLKNVREDVVIIDLAQAPGGVDYEISRKLKINAIYCPSLPARVAPYTAGKILKDVLIKYIK